MTTKRPPAMRPVYTVERLVRRGRLIEFHLVSHKFADDDTSGAYCRTVEKTFENLQEAITAMVLWNNVTNALPMRGDCSGLDTPWGEKGTSHD